MPGGDPAGILDFAIEAAWVAGKVTLRHFQTGVEPEWKRDHSPVTIADREAEAVLRARIERTYPGDGIVGEELGIVRAGAPRRWILDPIDGTRSFVRGVPLYGVLIGVEEGDPAGDAEVIAGVIHFPALGETVAACRGGGCWWNGRRCRVSTVDRLEEAALLMTDAIRSGPDRAGDRGRPGSAAVSDATGWEEGWRALAREAGLVRGWSDCYGHALVATGRAEAMIDPQMSVWDAAALLPVIEEAGGVCTDLSGRRTIRGGSLISTNALLGNTIRSQLQA